MHKRTTHHIPHSLIFLQVYNGRLASVEAVTLLKDLTTDPSKAKTPFPAPSFEMHVGLQTCITNALWFWGTQIDRKTEEAKWKTLCGLVKDVAEWSLVDPNLLKTSLEWALLLHSNIIPQTETQNETSIQKRLVRLNTGMVYRQQKYNLLREETEGYSKLVLVLNQLPITAEASTTASSDVNDPLHKYIGQINGIIGKA